MKTVIDAESGREIGFKKKTGHERRAERYFSASCLAALDWFDAKGNWISKKYPPLGTRERYWLSFALFGGGEADIANMVIRQGVLDLNEYPIPTTFNIFHTNIATILLLLHRNEMTDEVADRLENVVRDGFAFLPGNRQPDYQFHGYNDNMPAKATMSLILGGEMLGNPDAVNHGLSNLRQLRAQLKRRGINSECNSPTYTPLTIHALAKIAEYAVNEEAREIALGLESRLWYDLAARFHPDLGMQAGPYSRGYTADCLGHLSCLSSLLWFEFGDVVKPSPLDLFDQKSGLILHHEGDVPFNVAQTCWFPGKYHVPENARSLFVSKEYPSQSCATAEWGDFGPHFPARPFSITTHLEKDFSVGTMTSPMGGGEQTASYFVNYAHTQPVQNIGDRGTVYTKMVINDEVPGIQDNLVHRANSLAYQSGSTALVLSHPHLSLSEEEQKAGQHQIIRRISELVVFPSHFRKADELWVNGKRSQSWSGSVNRGTWIACRRGRFYMAVRPLAYSRTFGEPSISLETVNGYELIRTTFFESEGRSLPKGEIGHIFGGFVAEHASVEEYKSLDAFVEDLALATFGDYLWTTRRVKYSRRQGAGRPLLEMEVSWSPGSCVPRFAMINGKLVDTPLVNLQGVERRELPFLNDSWTPDEDFFPWEKIEVASANPTVSAIGDRPGT